MKSLSFISITVLYFAHVIAMGGLASAQEPTEDPLFILDIHQEIDANHSAAAYLCEEIIFMMHLSIEKPPYNTTVLTELTNKLGDCLDASIPAVELQLANADEATVKQALREHAEPLKQELANFIETEQSYEMSDSIPTEAMYYFEQSLPEIMWHNEVLKRLLDRQMSPTSNPGRYICRLLETSLERGMREETKKATQQWLIECQAKEAVLVAAINDSSNDPLDLVDVYEAEFGEFWISLLKDESLNPDRVMPYEPTVSSEAIETLTEPITEERVFYRNGEESSREIVDENGQVIMQEQLGEPVITSATVADEAPLSDSVIEQLFEEELTDELATEELLDEEVAEEEVVAEEELKPAAPVKQGRSFISIMAYALAFFAIVGGGIFYLMLSRRKSGGKMAVEAAPTPVAGPGPAQIQEKSKLEEVIEDLNKSAQ